MVTRRGFLGSSAAAMAATALPKGKADACIFLWLGGGAAQIDTFDPKRRGDGKKVAGSITRTSRPVNRSTKSAVVPFLLRGVADGPDAADMFQADRIHPVAAAQPRMLDNVWPELRKLL